MDVEQSLPPPSLLAAASAIVLAASVIVLIYRYSSASSSSQDANKFSPTTVAANGEAKGARSAEDDSSSKKLVLVLYGTQTGTAERFAKKLASNGTARYGHGARFRAVDVEDWNYAEELPKASMALFTFATYGDGEPTDSAGDFIQWLKDQVSWLAHTAAQSLCTSVPSGASLIYQRRWLACSWQEEADQEPLLGIPYAVFGLGNSQYEHFNAVGKLLDKYLAKIGGQRIVPLGLGDDDDAIEEDLDKWTEKLWPAMDARLGAAAGAASQDSHAAAPAEYVAKVLTASVPTSVELPQGAVHVPVVEQRELHAPSSNRSCVHVELDLTGTGLQYAAGDHVGVHPENPAETVKLAAMLLDVPLDTVLTLSMPDSQAADMLSAPPPTPATLEHLLVSYTDLLGPVSRSSLAALASCAKDPKEAARLSFLASPGGKHEFSSWVTGAQRSLLCVMQEFPSARPGLGLFFGSVVQRLQPRYYSISSAPSSASRLAITCAVVDEQTSAGRRHQGVASTWLAGMEKGKQIPAHVRVSHFKLPRRPETPVVMVGPGTGLAPFRGFLQARQADKEAGKDVGEALLFFGCREASKDYIYQSELEGFVGSGALSELHVAFSRANPSKKDYVQHHLLAQGKRLWPLLKDGGYFYVCGDAKHMARDVHAALIQAVQDAEGCSKEEAAAEVHKLSDSGRYQRDVW
mmetsp:Transcript_5679/g.15895  ORF Transcript_5679/g.15895 Transcript_5679/m.15895 type:complete len:690 (+) Transcript_5679:462-2531(+)